MPDDRFFIGIDELSFGLNISLLNNDLPIGAEIIDILYQMTHLNRHYYRSALHKTRDSVSIYNYKINKVDKSDVLWGKQEVAMRWIHDDCPVCGPGHKCIVFDVQCCDETHQMICHHSGAVEFSHHTKEEITAEDVIHALGGKRIGCADSYWLWQTLTEMLIKRKRRQMEGLEDSEGEKELLDMVDRFNKHN